MISRYIVNRYFILQKYNYNNIFYLLDFFFRFVSGRGCRLAHMVGGGFLERSPLKTNFLSHVAVHKLDIQKIEFTCKISFFPTLQIGLVDTKINQMWYDNNDFYTKEMN